MMLGINKYRFTSAIRFALTGLFLTLGLTAIPASASQPNFAPYGNYTSIAAAPNGGFWVQLHAPGHMEEYKTLAIDGAPEYDTVNEPGSITAIPDTNKYWVVTISGRIFDRGGAPYLCEGHLSNCSGYPSDRRIMAAAPLRMGTVFGRSIVQVRCGLLATLPPSAT